MRFTVTAEKTPDRKIWVLEEPTLGAVSQVRNLADAEAEMREAIAFLADISEDEVDINVIPILHDDVKQALEGLKQARLEEAQAKKVLTERSVLTAKLLQGRGYTQREIGRLMGVSHQSANQLVHAS